MIFFCEYTIVIKIWLILILLSNIMKYYYNIANARKQFENDKDKSQEFMK